MTACSRINEAKDNNRGIFLTIEVYLPKRAFKLYSKEIRESREAFKKQIENLNGVVRTYG